MKSKRKQSLKYSLYACAALQLLCANKGSADIVFNGGVGDTVYGVTRYGGGAQVVSKYISNNVTGRHPGFTRRH